MEHWKRPVHTSGAIKGTECDGCRCLDVIPPRGRTGRERYWCSARRERVEPRDVSGCDAYRTMSS